jgi:hypothetical protein
MLPITQILEIIKKQGATGVLALWLWYTHSDVQDLKHRLYDCYGKGKSSSLTKEIEGTETYAVIPKDELNEINETE